MEIPAELAPHSNQIPPWAIDIERFELCFALTRMICRRDDPLFIRQLYDGDIPTAPPEPTAMTTLLDV